MLITDTLSRVDYYQQKTKDAKEMFRNHILWKKEKRRWKLVRPYKDGAFNSSFWAEIVALSGGTLLVHGDFAPTLFCYYSGNPESKNDPLAMLRWIGSKPQFTNYLFQKARLGLQGLGEYAPLHFNEKVARWDCLDSLLSVAEDKIPEWISLIDSSLLLPEEVYRPLLMEDNFGGDYRLSSGFRDLIRKKEALDESAPLETLDHYLDLFGVNAAGLQEFILNKVKEDEICQCFLEAPELLNIYGEGTESGIIFNENLIESLQSVEYDYEYEYETLYQVGFVPRSSLFLAWAACAKALDLLEKQTEDQ